MSLTGTLLFVTSSIITMSLFLLPMRIAKRIDTNYAKILRCLLKPHKVLSRHLPQELTTSDLFTLRSGFFRTLYNSLSMHRKCKIIHVAGTKGKGSTVEYIASSLVANGYKSGIFTSPHIHTARERIKLDRHIISKEDMISYGNSAINLMKTHDWTVFFDLLLTTALLYFDKSKAEFIVLESGIGGRFDSTNFVDNPVACIITSISLDHQQLLGNTMEEIAMQKAGIIKRNTHVFTPCNQQESVMSIFEAQCAMLGATLHKVLVDREHLLLALRDSPITDVQVENACLAQAVLLHLNVPCIGWGNFFWPCRMEKFYLTNRITCDIDNNSNNHLQQRTALSTYSRNNINDSATRTIILDGCHNGYSVRRFLEGMRKQYPDRQLLVLFGAGQDKAVDDMLYELFRLADGIIFVQSKHFRCISEVDLVGRCLTLAAAVTAESAINKVIDLCKLLPDSQQKYLCYDNNVKNSITTITDAEIVTSKRSTVAKWLKWTVEGNYGNSEHNKNRPSNIGNDAIIAVCGSLFTAADAREYIFSCDESQFRCYDWVRERDNEE